MLRNWRAKLFKLNSKEIQSLNGMRAIAIIMVVIGHTSSFFNSIHGVSKSTADTILNLGSGVNLFFILSGFLISLTLYDEFKTHGKIHIKLFFIKRIFRIFPAYYIFLIFSIVMLNLLIAKQSGTQLESMGSSLIDLRSKIKYDFLYLSNYFESAFVHTWSLSLEEQFYIFFPFLAIFIFKLDKKSRLVFLLIIYFMPGIFRYAAYYNNANYLSIYEPLHYRFDDIVTGIIIMVLYREWDIIQHFKSKFSVLITFLTGFAIFTYTISHWKLDSTPIGMIFIYNFINIGFALIFILSLSENNFLSRFLSIGLFRPIARTSYTIYLWHILLGAQGFLPYINNINSGSGISSLEYTKGLAISLIILFIYGIFLYTIIEYPFDKIKIRILKKFNP